MKWISDLLVSGFLKLVIWYTGKKKSEATDRATEDALEKRLKTSRDVHDEKDVDALADELRDWVHGGRKR